MVHAGKGSRGKIDSQESALSALEAERDKLADKVAELLSELSRLNAEIALRASEEMNGTQAL